MMYRSMSLRRIACGLAVLAVVCVLTVFFFHAMEGPYSVVHGPVTALLSVRAATGLRMSILHAGLCAFLPWFGCALLLVQWSVSLVAEFHAEDIVPASRGTLRC